MSDFQKNLQAEIDVEVERITSEKTQTACIKKLRVKHASLFAPLKIA